MSKQSVPKVQRLLQAGSTDASQPCCLFRLHTVRAQTYDSSHEGVHSITWRCLSPWLLRRWLLAGWSLQVPDPTAP